MVRVSDASESEGAAVRDSRFPDPDQVVRYLQWAVLAVLALFGLVAAISLYVSFGRIIDVWVTTEFQPVFRAAFNLLVLLIVAGGISVLLRRIREDV